VGIERLAQMSEAAARAHGRSFDAPARSAGALTEVLEATIEKPSSCALIRLLPGAVDNLARITRPTAWTIADEVIAGVGSASARSCAHRTTSAAIRQQAA